MPTIELRRASPLTRRERTLLPGGLDFIDDEPPVLARIQLYVPLPKFVEVAVTLSRAVPDAEIRVIEEAGTPTSALPPSPPKDRTSEAAHRALVPKKRTFDDHGLEEDDPDNPWSALTCPTSTRPRRPGPQARQLRTGPCACDAPLDRSVGARSRLSDRPRD